jgi:uncharacterized protein
MAWLLNHFNFKRGSGSVLITNDAGHFMFLGEAEFRTLIQDPGALSEPLQKELEAHHFLSMRHRELFADDAALKVRNQKTYLMSGTQLHIFVLTNRCNQRCVYCQTTAGRGTQAPGDMTFEIAERAVEIAFQSPSPSLTFEFQGGEPTLNFETLRHIVEYAEGRKGTRRIHYTVVTNLGSVSSEELAFLADRNVSLSTSLDGPADLHTANRLSGVSTTFETIARNLESARRAGCSPVAIQTTTRQSLGRAREIVDTYIDLGFCSVFIRPLTPVGAARTNWEQVGYNAEEFLAFYRECLDYIVELAVGGVSIREVHASLFLQKILNRSTNYMELRSPCGAVIGQLAYNYDGSIYPCDEGRMLSEVGNHSFKIGDVFNSTLSGLVESPATRALSTASCLELLPGCSQCVYMPYCGTCPVVSFAQHGTLFPQRHQDYRCTMHRGMLDILFAYLQADDAETRAVLQSWAG